MRRGRGGTARADVDSHQSRERARPSGLWARCPGPSRTGEQRQAEALPRSDRTRIGSAARCRPELWRVHMQEPAPSVLGDAIERPSIHTARVGRVARRSQRLPAAGTACDRLGPKRRDVRGREPMGIPGHSGAQGGWRYTGHRAARMHRQRGGVHGRAARAGAGPLGVSIDRAKRGQVDLETSHRRMVLNKTGGPRPGSGASLRAAAAERNGRILTLADSGMTWAEIRAVTGVSRSTVARALRGAGGQGKGGGVSRTRSGCKRPGRIRVRLGGG